MKTPVAIRKPVGIWIRVSTEEQAQGESPEYHKIRVRAYADSKGWEVVVLTTLPASPGNPSKRYPQRSVTDEQRRPAPKAAQPEGPSLIFRHALTRHAHKEWT